MADLTPSSLSQPDWKPELGHPLKSSKQACPWERAGRGGVGHQQGFSVACVVVSHITPLHLG